MFQRFYKCQLFLSLLLKGFSILRKSFSRIAFSFTVTLFGTLACFCSVSWIFRISNLFFAHFYSECFGFLHIFLINIVSYPICKDNSVLHRDEPPLHHFAFCILHSAFRHPTGRRWEPIKRTTPGFASIQEGGGIFRGK